MKILSFIPALLLIFCSVANAAETSAEMMNETTATEAKETTTTATEETTANTDNTTTTEETEKSAAAEQQADPYTADNVARSSFTTGVENREPVDKLGQLTNDKERIYFFTEIKGMKGQTITHRWEHAGDVKAEVSFKIGSDRWRVWSSKNLQPSWVGEWIVSVVDENGKTLTEESMAYVPAEKMPMEKPEATETPADTPANTEPAEAPVVN